MEINRAWNKACRIGGNIAIIMFDADNFKPYNDFYGHVAGDECLKTIANTLNNNYRRAGKLVARYGGEEFIILICDSDEQRILEITNQAINKLADLKMPHKQSPLGHVNLSAGVSITNIDRNHDFYNSLKKPMKRSIKPKLRAKNNFIIKRKNNFRLLYKQNIDLNLRVKVKLRISYLIEVFLWLLYTHHYPYYRFQFTA